MKLQSENSKATIKLTFAFICVALITGLTTYQITTDKLTANQPLSISDQLTVNNLTLTNTKLVADILQPAFDSISLVGVSTTNNCSSYEKGCFDDKKFHSLTNKGPKISMLVYETHKPITADNIQQLKTLLKISPYSLDENDETNVNISQSGVTSLYDLSISADLGDTQIRITIRPNN